MEGRGGEDLADSHVPGRRRAPAAVIVHQSEQGIPRVRLRYHGDVHGEGAGRGAPVAAPSAPLPIVPLAGLSRRHRPTSAAAAAGPRLGRITTSTGRCRHRSRRFLLPFRQANARRWRDANWKGKETIIMRDSKPFPILLFKMRKLGGSIFLH